MWLCSKQFWRLVALVVSIHFFEVVLMISRA